MDTLQSKCRATKQKYAARVCEEVKKKEITARPNELWAAPINALTFLDNSHDKCNFSCSKYYCDKGFSQLD
jgi:hypothetical protein